MLRMLEHLRRRGHEALVIAPNDPRGVQDFGKKPKIGNPIQVDGMDLFIQNFDEQQGIYVITIDRKRQ